jgi:hypothetical protein
MAFAELVLTSRPVGRPSTYDKTVADAICERLAAGESMRKICKSSPELPSRPTIYRWLEENLEFARAYAIAMICRMEDMADECIEIADEVVDQRLDDKDPDAPRVVEDKQTQFKTRTRLEERHYWLSKMGPKKYGDDPIGILLPPPANGDTAKAVGSSPLVIQHDERDPMAEQIRAWERAYQSDVAAKK